MRFVWLSALASALGLLAAPLAAGAQPPASRIGFVMSKTPPRSPIGWKRSDRVYATSGTWKGRTSLWSIGGPAGGSSGFPT